MGREREGGKETKWEERERGKETKREERKSQKEPQRLQNVFAYPELNLCIVIVIPFLCYHFKIYFICFLRQKVENESGWL